MVRRFFQTIFVMSAVAVAILSLHPRPNLPDPIANLGDLSIHFVGYAALGVNAVLGWPARLALAAIALPVFGIGMEIGQLAVPGRFFEWVDALANTLGAASGVLVGIGLVRLLPKY